MTDNSSVAIDHGDIVIALAASQPPIMQLQEMAQAAQLQENAALVQHMPPEQPQVCSEELAMCPIISYAQNTVCFTSSKPCHFVNVVTFSLAPAVNF